MTVTHSFWQPTTQSPNCVADFVQAPLLFTTHYPNAGSFSHERHFVLMQPRAAALSRDCSYAKLLALSCSAMLLGGTSWSCREICHGVVTLSFIFDRRAHYHLAVVDRQNPPVAEGLGRIRLRLGLGEDIHPVETIVIRQYMCKKSERQETMQTNIARSWLLLVRRLSVLLLAILLILWLKRLSTGLKCVCRRCEAASHAACRIHVQLLLSLSRQIFILCGGVVFPRVEARHDCAMGSLPIVEGL